MILGSLAVVLAGGGERVSDLDILRTGAGAFGKVASNATVSRFFERTAPNPDLFSYGFSTLTRELRSRVWESAGDRNPALKATALEPPIIDLDATLVTSHCDKEQALGTYKGGYGLAPFIASVDYGAGNGTGEVLAAVMRPGNAGANSAEDHIKVFTRAIAQLPDVPNIPRTDLNFTKKPRLNEFLGVALRTRMKIRDPDHNIRFKQSSAGPSEAEDGGTADGPSRAQPRLWVDPRRSLT